MLPGGGGADVSYNRNQSYGDQSSYVHGQLW